MISLTRVGKSVGKKKARESVFHNVNARFLDTNYVIVGERGAGKTTLLKLLCGLTRPTFGRISRRGLVAFPPGTAHDVAGLDTVKDFVGLLSVVYQNDYRRLLDFVMDFSRVGSLKDQPILQMPGDIRGQVMTAMSLGIAADTYLFDRVPFFGNKEFKNDCVELYQQRLQSSNVIHVSSLLDKKNRWPGFKAVLIRDQNLSFFDCYDDAVEALNEGARKNSYGTLAYADLLVREDRQEEALEYLLEYTTALPHDREGSLYYIKLLTTNQSKGLEPAVSQHVSVFGYSPDLCLLLARTAERRGDFDQSLWWADRYLEESPASSEALQVRARALEHAGDYGAAGDTWCALIEAGGGGWEKFAFRAFVKGKQWESALDLIDRIAPLDNADGWLEKKGICLVNSRNFGELVALVESLSRDDVRLALSLAYRASVHANASQVLQMLRCLPQHPQANSADAETIRRINTIAVQRKRAAATAGALFEVNAWTAISEFLARWGELNG